MDLAEAPWRIYLEDTIPLDANSNLSPEFTGRELVDRYSEHANYAETFLRAIPIPKTEFRYAPGKWSIKQVVGHITDANTIFLYRLLCIARGESKSLPGFDENAYVEKAGFENADWANILRSHKGIAEATAGIILGLSPEAWTRQGIANQVNIKPSEMLRVIIGHEKHHIKVLKERYGLA